MKLFRSEDILTEAGGGLERWWPGLYRLCTDIREARVGGRLRFSSAFTPTPIKSVRPLENAFSLFDFPQLPKRTVFSNWSLEVVICWRQRVLAVLRRHDHQTKKKQRLRRAIREPNLNPCDEPDEEPNRAVLGQSRGLLRLPHNACIAVWCSRGFEKSVAQQQTEADIWRPVVQKKQAQPRND